MGVIIVFQVNPLAGMSIKNNYVFTVDKGDGDYLDESEDDERETGGVIVEDPEQIESSLKRERKVIVEVPKR